MILQVMQVLHVYSSIDTGHGIFNLFLFGKSIMKNQKQVYYYLLGICICSSSIGYR